jgi:shikimate dehydrogenase
VPGTGDAAPARYLVVGFPVAHSLSPAMMNAAFRAAGIHAVYEAREIPPVHWPTAMEELWREGIAGANVTIPHKEGALAGAREASGTARAIGAANVLIRAGGGWRADNTDGPGFLAWVEELGLGETARRETLVLGAGGSARAVVWALREMGARRIRIANRDAARARELARRGGGGASAEPMAGAKAPRGGLVVNCTSLGLQAEDPPPLGPGAIAGAGAVLDLVYPETALVRAARTAAIPAEDGLGMLVHQGCLAFERWTGVHPDAGILHRAAREEADRRRGAGR